MNSINKYIFDISNSIVSSLVTSFCFETKCLRYSGKLCEDLDHSFSVNIKYHMYHLKTFLSIPKSLEVLLEDRVIPPGERELPHVNGVILQVVEDEDEVTTIHREVLPDLPTAPLSSSV
jgi:hypothetical protein